MVGGGGDFTTHKIILISSILPSSLTQSECHECGVVGGGFHHTQNHLYMHTANFPSSLTHSECVRGGGGGGVGGWVTTHTTICILPISI